MAQVPVSSGPSEQIRVPEFGTSFKLMDTEGDKVNNDIFQKQLPESGNKLMQAYTDAYDRFSQMRVTDATNAIEQDVNDYLMGENGAMRQQGESVYNGVQGKDGQRKPFAEAHFDEIEKIIKKHRGGLDRQQGFRLDDKLASYKERIRGNLLNHQMQQIEKHETDTYRTRAQIAADGLMTNILDPNARQEYIESMKESIGFLYRNAPAETRNYEIKKALSGSLAQGMKSQIEIENLGGAQSLLNKYRKQMTGKDVMEIEHALRRAVKARAAKSTSNNAHAAFVQWDSPQGNLLRLFKNEGIEVTPEQLQWAQSVSGGDPQEMIEALVLGKEKFEAETEGGKTGRTVERLGTDEDVRKSNRIVNSLSKLLGGDKEITLDAVTGRVMEWAEKHGVTEEVALGVAKKEYARQKAQKAQRDAVRDQDFDAAFRAISNGGKFEDIPTTKTLNMDARDVESLRKLEQKIASGQQNTGDSMRGWELLTDPERVGKMTMREIQREAWRLTPEDYQSLLDLKSSVDKKTKNPPDSEFRKAVKESIATNGFKAPETQAGKAMFNMVSDVLFRDAKAKYMRENPGKPLDSEWVNKYVAKMMATKFSAPARLFGLNDVTGAEMLQGKALSGTFAESDKRVQGILNAGLIAGGVTAPEKYHRTQLLVESMIDGDKMYQVSDTKINAMYAWMQGAEPAWVSACKKRYGNAFTKRLAVSRYLFSIGLKRE